MAADYVLKEGNERRDPLRARHPHVRDRHALHARPGRGAWLKLHTHLPVIVDPSHASGDRRLVEPLSRAAAAVGADGIIVEVARIPRPPLCDGPQQLYAATSQRFAQSVAGHASLVRPASGLALACRPRS